MQTKYPHHVALVHSNDEYSDEPTHCVFTVRPSTLLKFTWYLALARLMKFLAQSSSELRFLFWEVTLLTFVEEDNLLGQETVRKLVEEGGFADEDQVGLSFNLCEESLRGHEVQMYPEGHLRFLCFNKHSGVEFFSDEISLEKLLGALRLAHVLVEVEHWLLAKRSLMFLRSLREKGL